MAASGHRLEDAGYERRGQQVTAFRATPHQPAKSIVVLAHATGNDALYPQAPLLLALLEHGHEVFLFDLDGHGRRSATTLSVTGSGDVVTAAVHAARRRDPTLPTHLIGASLGGALALVAASNDPSLASLTLISPPLGLDLSPRALANELLTLTRGSYWSLARTYGGLGLLPAMGPFRRSAFPLRLDEIDVAYPTFVRRLIARLDLERCAARLTVPTLIIHGTRDLIVPARQAATFKRLIPEVETFVAPGATHFSTPLEPTVIQRLCDFIEAVSPPSATD